MDTGLTTLTVVVAVVCAAPAGVASTLAKIAAERRRRGWRIGITFETVRTILTSEGWRDADGNG
jgi:hypothetical protein